MDQSEVQDRTMASSSSSAVLELRDADEPDGDEGQGQGAGAGDEGEPAPLIMPHGQDIAVKVDAPMKQLSTLETFVTYRVRCVCARWPTPPYVRRRYNHFKALHRRLSAAHPLLAAPALPPLHSARQQLDRYSAAFVAVRALALNAFLDRVAKHPIFTHSDDLRLFLTTPDDELDKVFKSENSALNLWGLSSALAGGGEAKPANGARVRDPEFGAAAEYLAALAGKLTALCALTTALYSGSVRLGTEYMGMRRACDAWAVQAGGRAARAAAACGAGAAAAGAARARAPLAHRAALPLLAAYAHAHLDKIRQRDALHAAYVSNSNATDELHNRLEQASEALRSELSDWVPKTRGEVRALLLALAERQAAAHAAALHGWERARAAAAADAADAAAAAAAAADAADLFKTVSRAAVLNLSPSRARADAATPTETERDLDDLDIENYDDSDAQDASKLPDDREAGELDDVPATELDVHSGDKIEHSDEGSKKNSEEFDRIVDGDVKLDSTSKEESLKSDGSKVSDPLQDFSEVDLS